MIEQGRKPEKRGALEFFDEDFTRKKSSKRSGVNQIETKRLRRVIEYRRCRRLMLKAPNYVAI